MFKERNSAEAVKSGVTPTTETPVAERPAGSREQRYRQAAELLREWKDDKTGYDDEIWPLVEENLSSLRTRCPE